MCVCVRACACEQSCKGGKVSLVICKHLLPSWVEVGRREERREKMTKREREKIKERKGLI